MSWLRSMALAAVLLAACSDEPTEDDRLFREIVNEPSEVPASEIVSRLDELLARHPEGSLAVAARTAREDFAAFAGVESRLESAAADPEGALEALRAYLSAFPYGFRATRAVQLIDSMPTRVFRARFYEALDGDPTIEHLEVAAHAVHEEGDPHALRLLRLARAPQLLLRVPDRELYAPLALTAGRIPFQSAGAEIPAVEVDPQTAVLDSAIYPGWGTLSRQRVTLRVGLLEGGLETWNGVFIAEDPPLPDSVTIQHDDRGERLLGEYNRALSDAATQAGDALRERLRGKGPLRTRATLPVDEWNEYLIHFVNVLQSDGTLRLPDELLEGAPPDRPLLRAWRAAGG